MSTLLHSYGTGIAAHFDACFVDHCWLFFCFVLFCFLIGQSIVSPSIYGFWLPLWCLLVIVLSVLWFTASDYLFGVFKLV